MKKFTISILKLLNLIAALALLLSYLANYISPEKIWLFSFFGLAYPFLLFINIAFIFLWLWRWKSFLWVSLIVLCIGLGNVGRYIQIDKPAGKGVNDSSAIRVMSYNVRVFNHFEWEKEITVRDSILSYINSADPQIVCMQEFLTRSDRKALSEEFIYENLAKAKNGHIAYAGGTNSDITRYGVATFTSFPIITKGKVPFKNSWNSCIYTDLKVNDDTIRVYNLHLQSIRLKKNNHDFLDSLLHISSSRIDEFKDIYSRLKFAFIRRAQQVDDIAEHIKECPYPVVVCGDFNDTPVSYTYHVLLDGLRDSFRESGRGIGNTYLGNFPSYRIDYIFHSESFINHLYRTCDIKLSDHYPVLTKLSLIK